MVGPFEEARLRVAKFGANLAMASALDTVVKSIEAFEVQADKAAEDHEKWRTVIHLENEANRLVEVLGHPNNFRGAPEA